jgi:hypothetical protein
MKYHTTTQAAKMLGLSDRQVRRYCVQGALGKKIGGLWLIFDYEIKAFVRAPKGRPPTSPTTDSDSSP